MFQQTDDVAQKHEEKVPVLVDRTSTMWVLLIHIWVAERLTAILPNISKHLKCQGQGCKTKAVIEVLCCMKGLFGEYLIVNVDLILGYATPGYSFHWQPRQRYQIHFDGDNPFLT